ncbi:MAG: heme exporter protein CcmB [Pseudomonadota bacterium]|nr:heme exporter protein CcmB [Pseudomonadota bacterium]
MRQMLRRELLLKFQTPASWLYPVVFFLMVLVLFTVGVGAEMRLLTEIGAAAIWIAALLSVLLGMDGLFRADLEDGTLEQIVVARVSLPLWSLLKIGVHWLTGGLMLTLLSSLSMPLFGLSAMEAGVLALSLLLGTPTLTLIAAVAAALTVSLRGSGILLPLIALPLQLPILVFATGAVDLVRDQHAVLPVLALLLGLCLLSMIVLPFAVAMSLRLALSS